MKSNFSGNVVGNNNANANTNNNNGNIVNVMPPGKKKRRRRSIPRNATSSTCSEETNVLSDASLISLKLIQVYFNYIGILGYKETFLKTSSSSRHW